MSSPAAITAPKQEAAAADGGKAAQLAGGVGMWPVHACRLSSSSRVSGGGCANCASPSFIRSTPLERFVTFCVDGSHTIWDLQGMPVQRSWTHPNAVNAVVLSHDSSIVATVTSFEGGLRLYELASGKMLLSIKAHDKSANDIVLLPDVCLAPAAAALPPLVKTVSADANCRIEGVAGQMQRNLSGQCDPSDDLMSLPGQTSGAAQPAGWPTAAGAARGAAAGTRTLCGTAITCSNDGTIRVWDLTSGTMTVCHKVHDDWVNSINLLQDRKRLVSASSDRTLKLLDLSSGEAGSRARQRYMGLRASTLSSVI